MLSIFLPSLRLLKRETSCRVVMECSRHMLGWCVVQLLPLAACWHCMSCGRTCHMGSDDGYNLSTVQNGKGATKEASPELPA